MCSEETLADAHDCPNVNRTMEWIHEKYGEEVCIMQKFNWMDDKINYLEDNVIQDIATLPNDIPVNEILKLLVRLICLYL